MNVCHRSLSRATVCVCKNNNGDYVGKITDFNAATKVKDKKNQLEKLENSKLLVLKDTNLFSAPEMLYTKYHNFSADIFSLGLLLNYLLYDTVENVKILKEIKEVRISLSETTPRWLRNILCSMTQYEAEKRASINTVI